MSRIWDYLMRRKPLLLAILAVFALSGWLSGVFLRATASLVPENASSLIVKSEFKPEYTTAYNTKKMISVKIANPSGQAVVAVRPVALQPSTATPSAPSDATDLEVPLTSSPASSQIIARWRKIVFQTSAALFVGAVACILVALLKRYFTHRRH